MELEAAFKRCYTGQADALAAVHFTNPEEKLDIEDDQKILQELLREYISNATPAPKIEQWKSYLQTMLEWLTAQVELISVNDSIEALSKDVKEMFDRDYQEDVITEREKQERDALGCNHTCPYCGAKCDSPAGAYHKHKTSAHRLMGFRGCHKMVAQNHGPAKLTLIDDMFCDGEKASQTFWKEQPLTDAKHNELSGKAKKDVGAADLFEIVSCAGGKSAALTFTLQWVENCDLDIEVTCDHGHRCYYGKKTPCTDCGIWLDIDMTCHSHRDQKGAPNMIENIAIPRPKNGHTYKGKIFQATTSQWNKLEIWKGEKSSCKILKTIENWGNKHIEFEWEYWNDITFEKHKELYAKEWTINQAGTKVEQNNRMSEAHDMKLFMALDLVHATIMKELGLTEKAAKIK